jgi:hypothetical protein
MSSVADIHVMSSTEDMYFNKDLRYNVLYEGHYHAQSRAARAIRPA